MKVSLSETLLLLPILQSLLARHSIYAPVGGVINQINFMSENALVKKGEVVAELIPKAVELMVHAQINPKDIINIAKGDRVKLRLSTKRFLPICQFGRLYSKNFCGCFKGIKI